MPLLERKISPTDSQRLCLRLVVRRRLSEAPLRASPAYPCINFPFSPILREDPNMGLQLCYQSRIQKHFPVNITSIRL